MSGGYSLVVVCKLLIAVASLAGEHRLWGVRASVVAAPGLQSAGSTAVEHGRSCSTGCGIFPDQGLHPCLLHWQADSLPLSHQGSLETVLSLLSHAYVWNSFHLPLKVSGSTAALSRAVVNSCNKLIFCSPRIIVLKELLTPRPSTSQYQGRI